MMWKTSLKQRLKMTLKVVEKPHLLPQHMWSVKRQSEVPPKGIKNIVTIVHFKFVW